MSKIYFIKGNTGVRDVAISVRSIAYYEDNKDGTTKIVLKKTPSQTNAVAININTKYHDFENQIKAAATVI